MIAGLAPYSSHRKAPYESYVTHWIWEYKYHSMFSCLQNTLSRLGGGAEETILYSVSEVFVSFYIAGQIFLWIPYSQGFPIDNEGSCRNGGGGTSNPLGIQLCSKGVLSQVMPGDGHLTNALHSSCEWPRR